MSRIVLPCLAPLAALAMATVGCAPGTPRPPTAHPAATCALAPADSAWLARAITGWHDIGERALELDPGPLPPLVLFDTRCVYDVTVGQRWSVTAAAHGGAVRLPNGRTIPPIGIGITSPARGDSTLFLALALPDAWSADPRYRGANETRLGWEQYLVTAFSHEMAHARMLPGLLPRLRTLEVAIFPDTLEDNLVQDRFRRVLPFARSVARETEMLGRAFRARTTATRAAYVRAALEMIRQRRGQYYTGNLSSWGELEQVFLDLEGVAQWTALHLAHGSARLPAGEQMDRLLARFRSTSEFWSEDQGLMMILVLDQMRPDWQQRMITSNGGTAFDLLAEAVR